MVFKQRNPDDAEVLTGILNNIIDDQDAENHGEFDKKVDEINTRLAALQAMCNDMTGPIPCDAEVSDNVHALRSASFNLIQRNGNSTV